MERSGREVWRRGKTEGEEGQGRRLRGRGKERLARGVGKRKVTKGSGKLAGERGKWEVGGDTEKGKVGREGDGNVGKGKRVKERWKGTLKGKAIIVLSSSQPIKSRNRSIS